jgi:conjugative transposon TraM protein
VINKTFKNKTMKPHTQQFIQRRRFYMVLPILVTPFLTMIFWALGGGQGTTAHAMEEGKAGLNLELPNAQFDDDKNEWDKLSLYQKAQQDSMKYYEAKRNDPYFRLPVLKGSQDTTKKPGNVNTSLGQKDHSIDENEARVNRKLEELYKNLNPPNEESRKPENESNPIPETDPRFSNDVDQLENMMNMMQEGGGNDEEMKEIQSVLDKVLDIQHPERVNEKLKAQSQKSPTQAFKVSPGVEQSIGLMPSRDDHNDSIAFAFSETNNFYGLDEVNSVENAPKAIQAEVYDAQTLISGSIVKLKLVNDIYVNGSLIPKDQFIYGVCALTGERLTIEITSIRNGQEIFPVALSVFDMDGLEGIYVPGALARTVAKQSSNQAISDLQLNTMNPSLGVQAASAGIETAKSFLSKKTKLIKVTVKAGYKVLLKDNRDSKQ